MRCSILKQKAILEMNMLRNFFLKDVYTRG